MFPLDCAPWRSTCRRRAARSLPAALAVLSLSLLETAPVLSQQSARRPQTARREGVLRVEATGHLRWKGTVLDPSGGAKTFWLRASAAKNGGRTTGGFTLDMPARMTGQATSLTPYPDAAAGSPLRAKLAGRCEYQGRKYNFEIEMTSNSKEPPAQPGGRAKLLPGVVSLKLTDLETKITHESTSVERPHVKFWDQRNQPAVRPQGGAVRAPGMRAGGSQPRPR